MAKKKNITEEQLIDWYMDYVIKHRKRPGSISTFAKTNNFYEKSFNKHFKNFNDLRRAIYTSFFDQTLHLILQMDEYSSFSARHKLISFYYTLFELLAANRDFILLDIGAGKRFLKSQKQLKNLRKSFAKYIHSLNIETLNFNEKTLDTLQAKFLKQAAWIQFLGVLHFWLEDNSPSYEKTDILIEKSINTGFDLINVQPVKSIIDLGKFLVNEKIKNNS